MLSEQQQESRVVQALEACPAAIAATRFENKELSFEIVPQHIAEVCDLLKKAGFVRLAGITVVDWYPMEPRFELVYFLHSLEPDQRLKLRCKLPGEAPAVDSVYGVWRSADWHEREVFDMFGVTFRNHPNLKRLLMPEDWQGHPLRKDFPVHGHKYSYQHE